MALVLPDTFSPVERSVHTPRGAGVKDAVASGHETVSAWGIVGSIADDPSVASFLCVAFAYPDHFLLQPLPPPCPQDPRPCEVSGVKPLARRFY